MQFGLILMVGLLLSATRVVRGADPGELVFQDSFQGKVADGWMWEREERTNWRVSPVGLEVRVQPGNMWGPANNARNVLVRPIPAPTDSPVEISVTLSNAPTAQWEQANLVWFYDDSNMVKLGQELVTGRFSIVMGREENDRARTVAIIPLDDNRVELRLQALGNRVRGRFRTRYWSEWRDVGDCDLPAKGTPKASLHFYNGSASDEHWVRVNDFGVRRLQAGAVHWPRVRVSEITYRIGGGTIPVTNLAKLSLDDGKFALVSDARGLGDDSKANAEQRIFQHEDGSCGWSWDRRSSNSKRPVLAGIGVGNFDLRNKVNSWFPPQGFGSADKAKPFELELNAVTRLENDQGDHNLSVQIWLTAQASWPPTHRINILFDWYGKQATGQSLNDGYRDYEFVEPKSDLNSGFGSFEYRIRGFRGAPPKVNLQAFLADAVKQGLPDHASILGVWFGNEIWDGSCGGTLVTKLDLVVGGEHYTASPANSGGVR